MPARACVCVCVCVSVSVCLCVCVSVCLRVCLSLSLNLSLNLSLDLAFGHTGHADSFFAFVFCSRFLLAMRRVMWAGEIVREYRARREKKQALQRVLFDFQRAFQNEHGRMPKTKKDKASMAKEYARYKV